MTRTKLGLKGKVEFILRGPDGKIKRQEVCYNDITDLGYDQIAELLANNTGSTDKMDVLGVGWGAGAGDAFDPTETDLQGANKDRKAASFSYSRPDFTITATWGVNEPIAGVAAIEEIGVFDNLVAGLMFSRAVRAVFNKLAVDTLEVNYTFEMTNP